MIGISDNIQYQINFVKNSTHIGGCGEIHLNDDNSFWDNLKSEINKSSKILLLNKNEIFFTQEYLDSIYSFFKKYPNVEYYISCASSTQFYKSLNPLVSLFQWESVKTRKQINWFSDDTKLFNKNKFSNIDKSIKGIISVRKQETHHRDYIFSKLNKDEFDGIFRYAKWHRNAKTEPYEYSNILYKNFPTIDELLEEYKKSYISFIIESDSLPLMNSFTEKTLIGFLTKTMPVIYGGTSYLKELSQLGFYTFNHLFDSSDVDSESLLSDKRKDSFVRCIEYYNSLSNTDVIKIYNSNINKINHNYELAFYYIFSSLKSSII